MKNKASNNTLKLKKFMINISNSCNNNIIAEDAIPTTTAEQPAATAELSPAASKPKAAPKPQSRPSERAFDPSEEISEDLSVPFPVDI